MSFCVETPLPSGDIEGGGGGCTQPRLSSFFFQGGEIQTRVGLLLLLCSWLSGCSLAVAHFLHNSSNIPYVSFHASVLSRGQLGVSIRVVSIPRRFDSSRFDTKSF